ncbi:MAG: hypothetical protein JJE46_11285 [Acidimicrobiia bacterium]|nr:hypothetical protein [Acidimicrobiia bacterium]
MTISAGLGVLPILLLRAPNTVEAGVLGASVLTALGMGYALEDTAAVTLDPVRTTLRTRSTIRIAATAAVGVCAWLVQLTIGENIQPTGVIPVAGWLAIFVALATGTLAVAATVRNRNPTNTGTTAAWTPPALVTLCFVQWQFMVSIGRQPLLTIIPSDTAVARWWWVTAVATIVLIRQTRDRGAGSVSITATRQEVAA